MKKIDSVKYELNPMSLMSLALSFVSLTIVTTMIFLPKQSNSYILLLGIDTFICLVFWCQLLADFFRSQDKSHYLKTHWLDFVASVPIIEQIRFARLLQIFRVIRLIRSSHQVLNQIRSNRREATVASIFLLLTVLISVGSALMLILEGNVPESNIKDASDALWWVFVTISTVGYGDHYPVTEIGKILAAVIIICGVGLFGMVAGLISSIISDPEQKKEKDDARHEQEWQAMLDNQQRLIERLEAIEKKLDQK
ncbi:potassium channel family protein [Photobacterium sp. DNB23_23_1]|uniref:Ion transporter n=1 Tax=Photobacterium pectinilyticum TaxID=2906793 RepID=A0ABT1N2T1_9GAMM|nr:ion transporter [Photobacterium sp. ZSDE20]MCQ1059047.1 ion transporter [Photobacterium sp. ZSDE20]MDD1824103.1 ion transporter [Photobacterium sp. ZSDE20]